MTTTEEENRMIRLVLDLRNVNILLTFWHQVKVEALKGKDLNEAGRAQFYIQALQEARAAHGIEPLPLELDLEEEDPIKAEAAPTNGQPDEGDA